MAEVLGRTAEQLLAQVRIQCGLEGTHEFATDEQTEKLTGSLYPGCRVAISWAGRLHPDIGVVFTLPGLDEQDPWMGGIVAVYNPNPQGEEDEPPVWVTIDELLKNPLVTMIESDV